ncbi:MAG: metal-dependent hydrolase [Clostridia bacterium]|nr:metal-dependent hydrolase [Clostridia bacterium]
MSKTHLTVGVAAALAACPARSAGDMFAAVIGGALGGVLCDVECKALPDAQDAFAGRMGAGCLTVALLAADAIMQAGLWTSIRTQPLAYIMVGALIVILTTSLGHRSAHRTFTHSLLYTALLSLGLSLISPLLTVPALAGGLSHLVLDTLNKRPVPWLYPLVKKGVCLKLCSAGKKANAAFLWLGFAVSVALLAWKTNSFIH